MNKKQYRLTDAAKAYGLAPLTLYRWRDQGRLICHQTPTGRYFVTEDEMERVMGRRVSEQGQADSGGQSAL